MRLTFMPRSLPSISRVPKRPSLPVVRSTVERPNSPSLPSVEVPNRPPFVDEPNSPPVDEPPKRPPLRFRPPRLNGAPLAVVFCSESSTTPTAEFTSGSVWNVVESDESGIPAPLPVVER